MVVDLENLSNVKMDKVIKFILENISDLVVITNDKFEIEIINDNAHKSITGYDDLDLTGKSLLETIHPKDRKKVNRELRSLLKNGLLEGKTRLKCKNGKYIWLKIDGQTFYDNFGNKKILLVGKEFFKHQQFATSQSTNEDKFKEMLDNLTEIRFWKLLQPKQAVAIYQESQEMLKLIMDNIPQYIAWKDKNLAYLGCNNNFLDLLDIENEEDLLGKSDFDLKWGEEYALSLYMNDSRVLESDAPEIHMIELWQNQKGVKMWFDINRIPLHDLNGNVVGILVTLDNITDRNFAEQQLKESEEMFRTIGEQSLMGISILQDDVFKYVNKQFAKIYGYTVDELLSWPELEYQKLTHPDDLFFVADQSRKKQVGEQDVISRYQFRGVKKSGEILWLEIFSKSISYKGYSADLIALIDVTEKKLAEQRLKESEEMFRKFAEHNVMGITINQRGKIIYANQAWSLLTGYTLEEIYNWKRFEYQKVIHSENLALAHKQSQKIFDLKSNDDTFSIPVKIITKNGEIKWVEIYQKMINYKGISSRFSTVLEITERKKAEEKVKESEEKLKVLNKELEHLIEERTKELKLSKEKYQLITENVNDSIALIDDDFNYEYINKIFEINLGYNSSELIGKNQLDLLHTEDMQSGLDKMKELLDKGESTLEVRIRKKDGNYVWIEIKGKIFYDNFNQKKALLVGRDITERKKTEQKLRESEEKYRLLFENSPNAIILNDEKGIIVDCNTATEDIFGVSREILIGQNYMKTQGASLAYIFKDRYDLLLEQNKLKPREFQIIRRDGKPVWINFQNSIIKMDNDLFVQSILQDITIRKKAEQNLKESEEKFRTITENSLMGIAIVKDNKFEYVNKALSNIYEYSIQEMMNTPLYEFIKLILPKEHHIAVEKFKKIITKSGKKKWIDSFSKTINYRGKSAQLLLALDITKRKQAEEKLRESEEKFRTITENSLMGILITQENEFKYVNEAMSNVYEFTIEEIMKWTIREFINRIHSDDRDYAVERLRKRLAENSELSPFFSFRIVTKSGKIKWIETSTKPINYLGKIAHLTMLLDITERKQAEEKLKESELKLREQNIELRKLDEIKNDFITMAAHELKTPLISISGYTEYILAKHEDSLNEITPEIKKDLTIVQKNSKRLQNLMDQLLDVMQIESKKIELYKHPMNIKKIIDNCIDELSYIIQEKNHNLSLNIDEDITLNVDSERFFEIISNLLSNAVKFTPKNGKIEISCDQRDDCTYLFKVKDNGIGLKTDELGKLFQKFQIIREYSGENYIKGTGIGLFISKGFVEAHGGKIWATSDGHNKGTTFSFTIPS